MDRPIAILNGITTHIVDDGRETSDVRDAMQCQAAYIEQIPSGLRPATPRTLGRPPGLGGPPASAAPTPSGADPLQGSIEPPSRTFTKLYLQLASLSTIGQLQAARAEMATRVAAVGVREFRQLRVTVRGRPWVRLYAGPFTSVPDAHRACAALVRRGPCLLSSSPGKTTFPPQDIVLIPSVTSAPA